MLPLILFLCFLLFNPSGFGGCGNSSLEGSKTLEGS